MSPIPFAIIGTGRVAADYLTALAGVPELELVGVADVRPEIAAAVGERWSCPAYADSNRLLRDTGATAVLVAVPPFDHEAVSLLCLEHGAHVLCEKPFALSSESGRCMLEAARSAGRTLTMSAKFRHVTDVIEAKARLQSGALGEIVMARNTFTSEVPMRGRWNADPRQGGGGVLIDNGTHSVDLLRFLFGPVTRVQAQRGRRIQDLEVEDTVHMGVGFRSGLIAQVDLSWSVATHRPWFLTIHGSEGSLMLGWTGSVWRRGGGDGQSFGTGYDKVDALRRQLRHFARVTGGEETPLLDEEDILASIGVIESAYRSLEGDGSPVVLSDPTP
jgi:predicted dehydrogenase